MASPLSFILILLVAGAASAGLIVALWPLLARYAMARPNARSSHSTPTPQGGGIAVVAAIIVTLLAAAAIGPDAVLGLWPLAIAVLLLAAVGACDDIIHLSVTPRFAAQFVAVGIVLATLPHETRIVPWLPWWVERAALLIAGVYAVNIVNFMDGLDWLTVAEVVPLTAGLSLLALLGALSPQDAVVAVALLGAIIGFAPFNRPVARLFLGDVGSLPIGLLMFWLLLRLAAGGHLVAALLLPLYYVGDATVTLLRRLARRENVLQAHRTHFYQRATDLGFSVKGIVAGIFVLNLELVVLAAAAVVAPSCWTQVAALALGVGAVGLLLARFARGKPAGKS
ncbi:MAG TPA: glycosyltransferase family 4 protein [Xanthobacteraceae bacterium]|nr:glycosyltransferase family 4 protein [Xanthobacteraceae bacterium]